MAKLYWYGHSCFMLDSAESSLVLDPYAPGSVPGVELPALAADLALCSHAHRDHGYSQGVRLSGKTPTLKVRSIPCFHDDVQGEKRGSNLIYIIDAEGLRFVHCGDLGHMLSDAQIALLGAVDVLMLPVGGFYTIDGATAHALAEKIGAKLTIPMHYRGEGFGYDVIDTPDEFTKLCGNVEYADSNVLELSAEGIGESKRVMVLRCPVL